VKRRRHLCSSLFERLGAKKVSIIREFFQKARGEFPSTFLIGQVVLNAATSNQV
jgi:hypothetical protein